MRSDESLIWWAVFSVCAGTGWFLSVFFFNDTATTEIYTLSLHDALPILCPQLSLEWSPSASSACAAELSGCTGARRARRSEEHTSELQSHSDIVCRLLLEKKKLRSQFQATSVSQGPAKNCLH